MTNMSSNTEETTELWRYTTTPELLFLFEEKKLPTKPITELNVGSEIPEQHCIENIASRVWEELRQVAEYAEWYVKPKIFQSTWDRFSSSTIALKSTKTTLLSQVSDQMAHIKEVEYIDTTSFSAHVTTDSRGNYPVDALGELFGVKSSIFDHEQTMRLFVVPSEILDESDNTFSYSQLESFDGSRPKISIEPEELIHSIEVSPNAPPYAEDVIKTYLDGIGFESLLS